ncbi:MAG: urea transporter [Proteobacteria bacterium]|nr:urea transporter [Pseudomonadota bacterium]
MTVAPPTPDEEDGVTPDPTAAQSRAEASFVAPPVVPAPTGELAAIRVHLNRIADSLGPALGNIFFIPHPWIGVILWGALAWTGRAGFALLGLGLALLYMQALRIKEENLVGGGLRANALLAAAAAGWVTAPTAYSLHIRIGMAMAAATFSFVLTAAVVRMLRNVRVPALLTGFSFTTATLFAMFPVATRMAADQWTWWRQPLDTPLAWGLAFVRSAGTLAFSPGIAAGAIILTAIFLWSRTALIAGAVAWASGALLAVHVTELGVVYYWLPSSYNYFMAGMAIGAFLIVPAYSSFLLAAMAGAGASLFEVALQNLFPQFAYLPVAAILTIWCGLATLAFAKDRPELWRNLWPRVPPETAWWRDAVWGARFGKKEPLLTMPVGGTAMIAQGFNGPFSHAGRHRHALDLVRPPSQAQASGPEAGGSPETALSNSLWGSTVTAPAAGFVERVRDGVVDNPVGLANYAEPWGNYVCIRLDQGGWLTLAHFRRGSVAVRPGMRVEIGTYLGIVGNSGRSPVPHLHFQVQEDADPGAPTLSFRLANYRAGSSEDVLTDWHAASVPAAGTFVRAAEVNPTAYTMLTSTAPGVAVWSAEHHGIIPRRFRKHGTAFEVHHRIDEQGRHRLTNWHGRLLLAMAPDAWRIIEKRGRSPFLDLLSHAVPSLPYAVETGLSWDDVVPAMPSNCLWLALAPYLRRPLTYSRTICIGAPRAPGEQLRVETVVSPRRRGMPKSIKCTFDMVRGPVEVEADFEIGSLRYTLVSFSPSLPGIANPDLS